METTKQKGWKCVKSFIPVEAKIPAKPRRVSLENIQQVQVFKILIVIGQFTADGRVGPRNQCTPAD